MAQEIFYKKYCKLSAIGDCIAGMTEDHARKYINQMKVDPDYAHGVVSPTQKTTIVNVDLFFEYMFKMDGGKFK